MEGCSCGVRAHASCVRVCRVALRAGGSLAHGSIGRLRCAGGGARWRARRPRSPRRARPRAAARDPGSGITDRTITSIVDIVRYDL